MGEVLSARWTGLGSGGQGPHDDSRGLRYVWRPGNDAAGTQVYFSAPFGNLLSNSGANLVDPWVAAGGNPMPRLSALQGIGVYDKNIPFFNNGNYVTTKMSDFDPVYMNQWNLNIQRQFGQNWLVTANYVGNNTIHMITAQNINSSLYFPNQTFTGAANNIPTCTLPNGV
jgi:hypothetical protein